MISISKFSKTFGRGTPNEVAALNSVDIDIKTAEFVSLIGSNGSGKSTLLNAIAGSFLGDAGKIIIDNVDVTSWQEYKRAKFLGRVFQNPYLGTASSMTIAENLQLAYLRGQPKQFRIGLTQHQRKHLQERIAEFGMGLENRMDTPIGLLSGGQRQALTLLMATLHRPKILLLDEHTAALDPASAEQVLYMTEKIIAIYGLTALMVTHSMEQAVGFGNRLIMMNQGKVAWDVSNDEKYCLTADDLVTKFRDMHVQISL
ncbi:ABC transporter-related protein [Chloroherpeton thalassium ATCC 35110]|uniref:ABC transporter-related protein n=1 Tax=Chloroherpeton thalassium (strain ATCC 35110 / GB-78) TaxID=517418 RepID=B3QVG5_CHLT3|nr:ATP-binding cassette domain-containing protein [Chloroherpeton thalassium]ACF14565.1 ABC transporter-related protein [Chloroherpeton thalassium ATCC 35110]